MILKRLLVGLAVATVGAVAVAITVKCISGVINKKKLKNLALQDGLEDAIVDSIERSKNRVTLKELYSKRKVSYQSDRGIASDVREGMYI